MQTCYAHRDERHYPVGRDEIEEVESPHLVASDGRHGLKSFTSRACKAESIQRELERPRNWQIDNFRIGFTLGMKGRKKFALANAVRARNSLCVFSIATTWQLPGMD